MIKLIDVLLLLHMIPLETKEQSRKKIFKKYIHRNITAFRPLVSELFIDRGEM